MKALILIIVVCFVPFSSYAKDCLQIPPPTEEVLKKLTKEDLFSTNPLMDWITATIDQSPGFLYEDKVLYALQNVIPRKAGYYYVMFLVDGQYGNGGMQQVLLQDPVPQNQEILKIAVEAFKAFGAKRTSSLIDELIPKAKQWMERREVLESKEADDSEFVKVWTEVDSYDRKYEIAVKWDRDPFKALLKDIKKKPNDYLTAGI